jgi:hypothetical protein
MFLDVSGSERMGKSALMEMCLKCAPHEMSVGRLEWWAVRVARMEELKAARRVVKTTLDILGGWSDVNVLRGPGLGFWARCQIFVILKIGEFFFYVYPCGNQVISRLSLVFGKTWRWSYVVPKRRLRRSRHCLVRTQKSAFSVQICRWYQVWWSLSCLQFCVFFCCCKIAVCVM